MFFHTILDPMIVHETYNHQNLLIRHPLEKVSRDSSITPTHRAYLDIISDICKRKSSGIRIGFDVMALPWRPRFTSTLNVARPLYGRLQPKSTRS